MDPPTKEQSDKLSTEPQTGDLGQPSDEQASAQKGIYLNISIRKHQKCVTTYDTYAVFHVTTDTNRTEYPGTHLAVDRRYSEFEWLQSRLIHTHPSLFVPPLPGKMLTTALDRFNENFLSARAAGLQLFLARIGRHPILSHDADFIAFLSLSKEELAKYRTSHQSSSILSNWLAETRLNFMPKPKSGMSYDSGNPRKSQEAALGLIGSSAMHQYEAEFKNYSEETNSFLSLAQCVARATDQIVTNLEGLGNGFNELAHCLATWPLQLNVQVDNETFTDRNALDNRLKSGGRVSQVGLDWNRERPVGPELAGKGATRAAREVAELASELRTDALANWKGAAAYAQSIKSVLGSRETLEKRYFELVNALKEETGESNPGLMDGTLTVIARSYLPWRQKGLPESLLESNKLLWNSYAFQMFVFSDRIHSVRPCVHPQQPSPS
ncbi:unnamed protein product [Calicophoron daubneyi]|uniref:PX domain-containing protein n=1 Tax=Calicophoron daubneyi TaxID=300641 RepID=A0AAV2T0H1_CALDB